MIDTNKMVVEDYLINRFTMAILPGENRYITEVLELEQDLTVGKRPMDVIDQSCRYFGSSYNG
ncbi:competence protein ComK [Metabacillus litoralis]|nr:competence protein ComK [Metabacillus litoralis]